MRPILLLGCLSALLAAAGEIRIVSVERLGLPPYEDAHRVYRLEARGALSPGELLQLVRPGEIRNPGRLRVLRSTEGGVLAALDRPGDTFPLKGDLALHAELHEVPRLPEPAPLAKAVDPNAPTMGVPKETRQFREALYFLPGDATLSPLGRQKLTAWAEAWGTGRWTLTAPAAKGLPPRLQAARLRAVQEALRSAGIAAVQVVPKIGEPPTRPDAVLVRFQEGEVKPEGKARKRHGGGK